MALVAALAVLSITSLAGAAGARGSQLSPSAVPTPGGPTVFRVDVSRYPAVGLVISVPGAREPLARQDFTVTVGGHPEHPAVRPLSPGDLQLVLAADADLPPAALRAEQAGAAFFLASLPGGAQTAAVDPARPGVLPPRLSRDPAISAAEVASLTGGVHSTAAAELSAALSAFSPGSRARRTVVLVVSGDQSLNAATEAHFRQQLAASGAALYVFDATAHGATAYDSMAASSGGFAVRLRGPGDWSRAFAQVSSDLGEQYYMRFTDTVPLPSVIRISVRTIAGLRSVATYLPAANPIAPPLLTPPGLPDLPLRWDHPLVSLAALLIILGIGYGIGMLAASRRELPRRGVVAKLTAETSSEPLRHDDLFFVFLMPCLNEEKVILNSLQRLLAIPGDDFVVLVVDDGSDDNTAQVVSSSGNERIWLLSRKLPQARQGKGEALNAAVRHLLASRYLADRDPDRVIVVVVDADGRLDPHAIEQVRPYFADPATGAVQIGVRINNRRQSWLARMQDMEFVIYTEVFQRGRRHLGSVGLGGNGQFMRLSAMLSLGPSPWTRSLTDDLDLGVRLLSAGWRNEYCSTAAVHQQGVVELGRLLRQRSRWFQGHLQSWKLIPLVLRSAPRRARTDLIYHLSSPAVLLIASLLTASFILSMINSAILAIEGLDPFGWWVASTYALTFGPALIFSSVYWTRERGQGVGPLRLICFAHLYVCYGMMWYASGWWAVGRTLRGRTGWAKTDRVAEVRAAQPAPVAAAQHAVVVVASDQDTPEPPSPPIAPVPAIPAIPAIPAVPAVPGPERPRRAPRRRLAAVAAAAMIACVIGGVVVYSGFSGRGRQAEWVSVFNGYGRTSLTGSAAALTVTLQPAQAQATRDTHAALVVSTAHHADFVATLRVRTDRQLRHGAAGRPNAWEVGWVVWHYTSNQRFYALTLEPTGWVLSKQDPAYPGGQRFLASARTPVFRLGVSHTVGIVQVGNRITVSADGHLLTQFTDTQRPYLTGAFGFYCEDAQAQFSQIRLHQLSPPQPSRLDNVRSSYPPRKAPVTDAAS